MEWRSGDSNGRVSVTGGMLQSIDIVRGGGSVLENQFSSTGHVPFRLALSINGFSRRYSKDPTIISITNEDRSFSFLLRDVDPGIPIYIPEYGAGSNDHR